jgi:pimeloyl-ACP methyl ester carboxylesterase
MCDEMRAELVLPETAGEGLPPVCAPRIRRRGAEMSLIELNETRGCSLDDRSEQTSSPGGSWSQAGTERSRSNAVHTARTRETTSARSPRSSRSTGSRTTNICMTASYPSWPRVGWCCSTSCAGGIRRAHGLSLQRQQPDGRPGCGHRIAGTLHSGARRPRPARDRAGLGPPRAGDDAGLAERVLLPDAAAAADAPGDLAVFHPVVRGLARPPSMWFGGLLFRRTYRLQVDRFIRDAEVKARFGPLLYEPFARRPTSHGAFFDLNRDLLSTLVSRNEEIPRLRRFTVAVRIVFGTADPYPNAGCPSASTSLCPPSELFLLPGAHHYLQMDEPRMLAQVVLAPDSDPSPDERKPGSGEAEARKYKKEEGRLPRGLARVSSVRVPGKAISAARSARPDGTIDFVPLPRTTSRSS